MLKIAKGSLKPFSCQVILSRTPPPASVTQAERSKAGLGQDILTANMAALSLLCGTI